MAATTKAIQARHERTRLQLETVRMEAQLNQLRAGTAAPLLEAWGDIVNPYDWMDDDPTFGPPVWTAGAAMGDRADGRNSPIVQTEDQLSAIRATARLLFEISAAAKCATKNLVNFIVGTGLTYKVVPRRKDQEVSEDVLGTVQAVVDDFLEQNDWVGDQEREVLWRGIRDGETFLSLWPEGGRVAVRIVEPEQVSEPTPIPEYGHCYTFGIDTDAEDVQSVLGYWVRWNTVDQHDYLHAGNMEHVKRNVDRNIKRGLSDFYAVYQHLQRAEKLLRNAAEGAAIQAAIAYIREHVPGVTQAQVETLRGGDNLHQTYTFNTPNQGQKTRYVQKLEPGSVLDVGAGTQYKPGPLGSAHVPSFIAIEQAVLRFVGTNWCMPEYLISGDASNANYSSTMVAEAPFTKACEAEQALLCKRYKRLLWKVLAFAHGAGRLGGMPLEEVRRLVDLQITGPRVAARNIRDEVERAKALNDAGILSRETWAADEGLDYQDELSKGAEPAQKALPFGGQPGAFGGVPQEQQERPTVESFDPDQPRDDHGRWVETGEIAAAKSDPAKAAELRAKVTDPKQRAKLDKAIGDKEGGGRVTETPEFTAWFGNSKVVDSDGKPLVVYHGTAADFTSFDSTRAGTVRGASEEQAIFFSTNVETADQSADVAGAGNDTNQGNVYPVYLRVENPLISTLQYYNSEDMAHELRLARTKGHDGVMFPRLTTGGEAGTIAVFSPTQIKSASGNRGTFDPNSPNINESRRARLAQAAELIWEGYP